jgi:hypothetical protein
VSKANSNASFRLTITTSLIQIAEGAGGSIFDEFWPDISRRLLHKDPTHGLDARAAAEEKAHNSSNHPKAPSRPRNRADTFSPRKNSSMSSEVGNSNPWMVAFQERLQF